MSTHDHNVMVKSQNKGFAAKVVKAAYNGGDFEESDSNSAYHSDPDTGSEATSKGGKKRDRGALMVLNIDLGARGHQVLQGLSNQNPKVIAEIFCKKHKLGPKTEDKILKMVLKK